MESRLGDYMSFGQDETETVIRIPAFGAAIKVTAPQRFISLISDRIEKQFAAFLPGTDDAGGV